jgi:hypothetical protein
MSKQKEPDFDTNRMTQEECARMFGVTARTLRSWEEEAKTTRKYMCPFPRAADGTYCFRTMWLWMVCADKRPGRSSEIMITDTVTQ